MIVSVSRRTDIPAFLGDWFITQLRKGEVAVANPFNPALSRTVSLKRSDVDAFIFWTRNPGPFLTHLDEIDSGSYPYYFLITINRYPKILEPFALPLSELEPILKKLHSRIGSRRIIWRYDPVIFSDITDLKFHRQNFLELSQKLSSYSHRVIISLLDLYPKVVKRLKKAKLNLQPEGKNSEVEAELLSFISDQVKRMGMEVQSCAEGLDHERLGIRRGKCIDDQLLHELFGLNMSYRKDPNQRPLCLCHQSIDIGQYKTCRFDCLYCYAR